jgi:hypothetical protein
MSAVREARADAMRRLLVRHGGSYLLDRAGFRVLEDLGFTRAEATRAFDDLAAAGEVEFGGDRPMLLARLTERAAA